MSDPDAQPRFAVGIDLGGTKIAAGVFDARGRIRGSLATAATQAGGPGERTVENLHDAVSRALRSAEVQDGLVVGIGLGSTGPIDPSAGRILEAESLPHLWGYPLGAALESRHGLPVRMTNDANAFALAEATFGAGHDSAIVVGITLGTGCGCGITIHGMILEGTTSNAGELYRAPLAWGRFDDVLSGRGLERVHRDRTGAALRGSEVARLADSGDPGALETFATFGRLVGEGLGLIAAVIDPGAIVLGGSVSRSFRHYERTLRERFQECVAPQVARSVRIAPSALGASSGALGGATLFLGDS